MLRRIGLAGILVLALLAGMGGWVTSASVAASPQQLAGMQATVTLPAGRTAVWHTLLTPQGMCDHVFFNCQDVRVHDRNHYDLKLQFVMSPAAFTTWMQVRVTQRKASTRMRLHVTARTSTGRFAGDLEIRLSGGRGANPTTLRAKVLRANGTGVTGRAAIQTLAGWPGLLTATAADLTQQYEWAGASLAVQTRTAGRKLVITPGFAFKVALNPAPIPTGKLRVYRNGHRICTRTLKAGTASCRITRPRKATRITIVATGSLGNGYPLWHTATRRVQP